MADRPNILWFQFDEIRADAFSCYDDNPWLRPRTPNVQRVADEGVVFEQAFCPSPVCMPSRGSELTSQYATTLGVYHNVTKRLQGRARFDTSWLSWPKVLRQAGYRAVNVGKLHIVDYDVWDESVGRPQYPPPKELLARREELGLSVLPGIELCVGGRYPLESGDYESFGARRLTRLGLARLDELQRSGRPWLLRMSYVAPHTPVLAPPPYDRMYDPDACAFDPETDRPHEGMSGYERWVANVQQSARMSPEEVARARATYFGLVSALDAEIGLMLDAAGDDVIVLITGDHGAMLGEMGLWQKQVFHRNVHRVPFILRAPGLPPGRRSDLIDLLDTGPTLLALCGLPIPETFMGRNVFQSPLPAKDHFSAFGYGDKESYLYEALFRGAGCPRRICIRSGPYRLDLSIRREGRILEGEEQDVFYCCAAQDPLERVNAAGDASAAGIMDQLRNRLLEWHEHTRVEATG